MFHQPPAALRGTNDRIAMKSDEMQFRVQVLRAAGYDDAADLLEWLPATANTESAPPEDARQRPMTPAEAQEAERQAQGQALFTSMQNQLGSQWTSLPVNLEGDGR